MSTDSPQAVGWAVPLTIRQRPPARPTRAALVHAVPTSRRRVSSVSGTTRAGPVRDAAAGVTRIGEAS
jgi:hypothetical protein